MLNPEARAKIEARRPAYVEKYASETVADQIITNLIAKEEKRQAEAEAREAAAAEAAADRAATLSKIKGFDAVICPKCHGEGIIYGYRHVDGGQCFKCEGRGNLIAPHHAAAFEAWKTAVAEASAATFGDIAEGDEIRDSHGKRRTIVEVVPDDYNAGRMVYVTKSGLRIMADPAEPVTRYVAAEDLPKPEDFI